MAESTTAEISAVVSFYTHPTILQKLLHSLHRQHLNGYNTLVISILYFVATYVYITPNLHLTYTGAYSPRFFINIPDILSEASGQSVRLLRGKCPTTPW